MKILAFSDSHHDVNIMTYVIEEESPDMVIHLGDNISDAYFMEKIFPSIQFKYVAGNCDFENVANEITAKIEDHTFFITHGNSYNVKIRNDKLINRGLSRNANIILFGHTHKSYIQNTNNVWIINPGSISSDFTRDPRATFARMFIENGVFSCEIVQR